MRTSFPNNSASLRIYLGPMYSGKTTQLLRHLTECIDVGMKRVAYVCYSSFERETNSSSDCIRSHSSGLKASEQLSIISVSSLSEVDVDKYDVIGVDEAQFFKDLREQVESWLLEKNKIIIVCGLDGDHRMKPFGDEFGDIFSLIPLCSSVTKLSAICFQHFKQKNKIVDAHYSFKISGDRSKTKDIGGKDKYVSLCLQCHRAMSTSL